MSQLPCPDERWGRGEVNRLLIISTLFFTLIPSTLVGWGPEGHEIVAKLAQSRLSNDARAGIRSLIGNESLASIANWADEVRPERDESYGWHFVDIPKDAPGFSEHDCFTPASRHKGAATDHHNCVVDRIEIFERVLADRNAPREERVEALKFLVHFVGDVHQPFHALGEAAGGNWVKVSEFGSTECGRYPCNLHDVWDSGLIQHTGMNVDEYAAHLNNLIAEEHLIETGTPEDWANQSHRLALVAWVDNGGQIDQDYYRQQIKIVDKQLALAGLRLAAVLNKEFAETSARPQQFSTESCTNTTCKRMLPAGLHQQYGFWRSQMMTRALLLTLLALPALAQQGPCTEAFVKSQAKQQRPTAVAKDAYFFSGALDKPVVGRTAAQKAFAPVAESRQNERNEHVKPDRIVVDPPGDMAYEYGTVHASFDERKTGKHIDFTAAYLRVWRAVDGSCKLAAEMFEPEGQK